jgi:Uma2 family endonuclease
MIVPNRTLRKNDYPTTDGKPMAETELHGLLMFALIGTLRRWYAREQLVYVWGNLLIFYEQGNKRRHVSPDVFVVKGVPKHIRDNYLVWEEGHAPEVVIELTSSSTRHEDTARKFRLYQDTLRVPEYLLFDPHGDHLSPTLQGYRLHQGQYVAIKPVDGRLPSKVLGLHFEGQGDQLRLYNPATGHFLLTPEEEDQAKVKRERRRVKKEKTRADEEKARADEEKARAEKMAAEIERLQRELEELRQRKNQNGAR